MADISYGLERLLSHSVWPSRDEIEGLRVYRPIIASSLSAELTANRWCALAGPPRSGKTVLTHLLAWEVDQGEHPELHSIRALDLTDVTDPELDISQLALDATGPGWLIVVDNWHASSDSHRRLLARLHKAWERGAAVLVVTTTFPDEEVMTEGLAPRPPERGGAAQLATIQLGGDVVTEIAREMVRLHFKEAVREAATGLTPRSGTADDMRRVLDDEDIEQAIVVPPTHKKVRGNLRFLRWRLDAWRIGEQHLREVGVEQVLDHVWVELAEKAGEHIGALERVAALAQWELPYVRSAGETQLAGIEALERLNLVQEVRPSSVWKMDSTDAYLLMVKQSGGAWSKDSARLLIEYLKERLEQVPQAVKNVRIQTWGDVKTHLLLSLFQEEAVINVSAIYLRSVLREDVKSFMLLLDLVNGLMRDLPEDASEAEPRLKSAALLLEKLNARDVGTAGRGLSLLKFVYFFNHCAKDKKRFGRFVIEMLEGYGREQLVQALSETANGQTQRNFLKRVGVFDASLRRELQAQVRLRPVRRKEDGSRVALVFGLQHGMIESGKRRKRFVARLADIDQDTLTDLARGPRGIRYVQSLLLSALSLSSSEAARIAALIPGTWSTFVVRPAGLRHLAYLLQNCAEADYESGQRLLDRVLDEITPSSVPGCGARDLSWLILACERVRPGVVRGQYEAEAEALAELLSHDQDEKGRNALLVSFAALDPETLGRILDIAARRHRGWLDGMDPASPAFWVRIGVLSSLGCARPAIELAAPVMFRDLATGEPVQALFALHGLQKEKGEEALPDLFEQIVNDSEVPSWLPLLVGRHPMPWTNDDVRALARRVLRSGAGSRVRHLDNSVVAAIQAGELRWPLGFKMDRFKAAHQSLETAIHEGVILLDFSDVRGSVGARPNPRHPIVQGIRSRLEVILTTLDRRSLTLHDWDLRLEGRMNLEELDYWRAKLVKIGALEWYVKRDQMSWGIVFRAADEIDRDRIHSLLHLTHTEESPKTLSEAL